MHKWRIGSMIGGLAVLLTLMVSSPAGAFSLFGINFGPRQPAATTPPPQSAVSQQADSGISTQATTFLNDIVANANSNTCLQFTDHEYEVCSAYIFNASLADLVPYYKYANSANTSLARLVSYRLDSRYTDQANQLIRDRVSWWPGGIDNDVDVPSIRILSVNANLSTNRATLRTVESWRVSNHADSVVYEETDVRHTITMARVPSYLLHKWVVTTIE